MSDYLQTFYRIISDLLQKDPDYRSKHGALDRAKLVLLQELEQECGADSICYLDAYSTLEGETQELREQALFLAALRLGFELGRL